MPSYFDYNATTPLLPVARDAWLLANEHYWHNASALYHAAGFTAQKLDAARERLAELLCCDAERVVFTSGATESNNALFASLARTLPPAGCVAISAIEHPSVREAARTWLGVGRVIEIPVNNDGIVEPEAVLSCIDQHRPVLVSVMAANNESGTLQPWAEIAELCAARETKMHCDAAQWLGKQAALGLVKCSYITGSAHKFGGPKGTGFLVLSDADERLQFLRGGPQEQGRRAGTENYPAIESMVSALETLTPTIAEVTRVQTVHRDQLIQQLRLAFPELRVIGEGAVRLWNTVLMVMPRHDNLKWLTRLSRLGFSISTGSACSSGKEGSSVVVQALGASPSELRRVLRISAGWQTTAAEWNELGNAMVEVMQDLDHGGITGARRS
jgi:cysteine desulfurase